MGKEARARGTYEERVAAAIARKQADAVGNPAQEVYVKVEIDAGDGKRRWVAIGDAPFEVRKRAQSIANECRAQSELRLQGALKLLLGELPPLQQARDYLSVKTWPVPEDWPPAVDNPFAITVGRPPGTQTYYWNGVEVLDVYPIEVRLEDGKISVRQFCWCPIEHSGAKGMNINRKE